MRNLRSAATTALLVAGALALAACGDDDTAAPSTTAGSSAENGDAAGDPTTVECEAGDAGQTTVEIADFLFTPTPAEVAVGGTVTFTNTDDFPHSIWSAERESGDRLWESIGADPGAHAPENLDLEVSSTCTFAVAGTYEYICGIHNTMRGTITVG